MLSRDRRRNLQVATMTAVIALAPLVMLHALRACVIAAAVTLALRAFYRRWLGGVTGDLIGAAGEMVETAVLIALSRLRARLDAKIFTSSAADTRPPSAGPGPPPARPFDWSIRAGRENAARQDCPARFPSRLRRSRR